MTEGIHTNYSAGYKVWETDMEIRHMGGIVIICQEEAGWQVESATRFGLNVVSFTITEGWKLWYVVRAYIPPFWQPMVHQVYQALVCGLEGAIDCREDRKSVGSQ